MSAGEVEQSLKELFDAYDVDLSGEISKEEWYKIEMAISFERGEDYDTDARQARFNKQDTEETGSIGFTEFRERQMRLFTSRNVSTAEMIDMLRAETTLAFQERKRLGPRYDPQIRDLLSKLFRQYDKSGDGVLSPIEWIDAQKVVAAQVGDDIDPDWINEKAFHAADLNGDGVVQLSEYFESNFAMFEGCKRSCDDIARSLKRIIDILQKAAKVEQRTMEVHVRKSPDEWGHLEYSGAQKALEHACHWETLKVPMREDLSLVEIEGLVRMQLNLDDSFKLSVYHRAPEQAEGPPVILLRNHKQVEASLAGAVKKNGSNVFWVKNIRQVRAELPLVVGVWREDREKLLERMVGCRHGFDFEYHFNKGVAFPPAGFPLTLTVGDTLVFKCPLTEGGDLYDFAHRAFCSNSDVLAGPVEEEIVPKAPKKAKANAKKKDSTVLLSFVASQPGTAEILVEFGWEGDEPKISATMDPPAVAPADSIAQLGPFSVVVEERKGAAPNAPGAAPIEFWNGEMWGGKPVKPKKGKK